MQDVVSNVKPPRPPHTLGGFCAFTLGDYTVGWPREQMTAGHLSGGLGTD